MTSRNAARRVNFTKAAIEAMQPEPDKFYTVNDTKQVGLCIRVMTSGAKYFVAYRKVGGRPQRKTIGRFPEVTVDQARTHVLKLASSIADGENPFDDRQKQRQGMTVGELHARFIEEYSKPRKKSWMKDLLPYNKHLKKHWHSRKVSSIDSVEVQERFSKIGKDTPIQANRVLSLISKMFGFAKKIGVGPAVNPADGIDKYPENERQRYLNEDELARFATALDAHNNQLYADFFRVALFVGVRRGNIMAMRKDELDIKNRRWTIQRTKNKKPLVVHLSAEAVLVLQRRLVASGNSPWVFPSARSGSGHITEPKNAWAQVCADAKLSDFRVHDLRHTFASGLARAGISQLLLGQAMGHLSYQSTKRYSHLNVDDVSVMIDQTNAKVARTMGAGEANAGRLIPDDVEWDDCDGGVG